MYDMVEGYGTDIVKTTYDTLKALKPAHLFIKDARVLIYAKIIKTNQPGLRLRRLSLCLLNQA